MHFSTLDVAQSTSCAKRLQWAGEKAPALRPYARRHVAAPPASVHPTLAQWRCPSRPRDALIASLPWFHIVCCPTGDTAARYASNTESP